MSMRRAAQLFSLADFLWDELLARQWTMDDAAGALRMSRARLAQILTEARATDYECEDIGNGLGTSGQIWINLRDAYEEWVTARAVVAKSAPDGRAR